MTGIVFAALGLLMLYVDIRGLRRAAVKRRNERAEEIVAQWRRSGFWAVVHRDKRGLITGVGCASEREGQLLAFVRMVDGPRR